MSEPRVGPTLRVVLESFWEVIDFMSEEKIEGQRAGERILSLPLVGEIKDSYLNYAMSVIVGRALPDVRDGLKPVQRRVLYAMSELGLRHNSAYKKSARIVGETMGKYHPHGDSSIYDTMVRLAQDWSLRYCLVDGQGNFGSVDGDRAAAMRYTEARLHELGELMLADIDEDTVEWGPNFDESLKEPLSLPSVLPNLLVNGSTGIAVGMATNIPPHNLREVTDVLCWLLEEGINPAEASLADLMERLPGPDFPTGGQILGRQGIYDAYRTGRGKVIVRGRMHVEDGRRGKVNVIVTEIPYAVNKTTLIETMVKAAQDKVIDGIQDIRDESNREGMRIVLELSRDANPDLVMRQLYKRTQLQATFGVINLALDRQTPRLLPLASILGLFLSYRRDVVRRRTQFRLNKASGAGPHRRGAAEGGGPDRRGDPPHPGGRERRRGGAGADRPVWILPASGPGDFGHAPAPPHGLAARETGGGDAPASGGHRVLREDSGGSPDAGRGDPGRAGGPGEALRGRAEDGDPGQLPGDAGRAVDPGE
ncbi:Type IIA topoisomerase (DNA gyrase/topo II, topoisomerase IV), A subunit [Fretibacterium fastidiosum]|uniref:DNA topoisomerase (ATP-hydrolyzing) n=1 Tax=Fretibacterium fastidiosum TaxID=651822 RepID=A0AB94IVQ1_9BACT|nr:Type IIA topoisomerase (DNA gyrase/topo II, topoisomerase IV), A subunit [Fretibacterium fastidiosum]